MELTNAVSSLFKPLAQGSKPQSSEAPSVERARDDAGFRKIAFHGQRSQETHLSQLNKRLEQMSNMLVRLMQSAPALNDASSVLVERARGATSSFAYSFTQSESGVVTESFSFKIQFKAAGESGYTETAPTPPSNTGLVSTTPVTDPDGDAVAASPGPAPTAATPATVPPAGIVGQQSTLASTSPVINPDGEPAAAPVSFDERVSQLISYYRIDIAVATTGGAAAAAGSEEASAVEQAPVEAEKRASNIINIDADRVRRVRTGGGDDVLVVNAERARRISTGGGDDSLLVNAERVGRVNSGSGDDFIDITADRAARIRAGSGDDIVNIDADRVRRVNSGSGDDVVNIAADRVRGVYTGSGDDKLSIDADRVSRIRTGEGDDTLSINADRIRGIHTGSGDDTLNLTADSIKYVNAGSGNDKITLDAEDAAIYFGKGGGEDVIDIASVGALAIRIDDALAESGEEINIVKEGDTVTLEFASGERLTINNVENADAISVRIGDENINLQLSEAPFELDMSA